MSLSSIIIEKSSYRKAIINLVDSEFSVQSISDLMNCSCSTVRRCIKRNIENKGLNDLPRSGRDQVYNEDDRLKIIAFYCQTKPLSDCGRWTLNWASNHLKENPDLISLSPSKSTIQRILKANNLKPHLSHYFLHITDPNFFPKMEHLLSLYKNPPRNLIFFDESPAIQVLTRLIPDLRTESMCKRLEEFEYIKNGTMDIFAFLNHSDGKVFAECHRDHKSETFIKVFKSHASKFSKTEKLHYVMDNLSTHRSYKFCQTIAELCNIQCPSDKILSTQEKRSKWLGLDSKRIVIHFTPYHGSWLNLVEIWFSIIGKKVLKESYSSPEEFKKAIELFIEEWNLLLAHPFDWSYEGKGLHEKAVKRFILILKNSTESLEVTIITKGLGLMINLMRDYYEKISEEVWKELTEVVLLCHKKISTIIDSEEGPIRKLKAIEALGNYNFIVSEKFQN